MIVHFTVPKSYTAAVTRDKTWRPNGKSALLLIWHIIFVLPFCFCMSGHAEQRACDSTWMLFDRRCTGSAQWLIQLFCDYGAQLGDGQGSKFMCCQCSKYTPWHEREASTSWQMCCTETETEMDGCQLAIVGGCFMLHVCDVCHISLISFCALRSGFLFIFILYYQMLSALS